MRWLCKLGLHKWGLLFIDRMPYSRSLVYGVACYRCGSRARG